ncbi:Phosphoenolpyruvate-protein phosphotransferase [Sporomusa silvacetica DSM 10669]|uniref:Phosphoenolpyruvate-protein phosphotransferase n=1 Tax=Sporomusa silvacetica DSM 10669 TaxID=1123289 RepID=A0ABZ3IW66_9FIRM|nr:phosphoenolpyruvate--protein phosphotransferase [Sporomusa silvacetica]OZC14969.1 phosphoenolpyruvate-protein phosphotransferase [Sporomusa silvacetica DSM 10669]
MEEILYGTGVVLGIGIATVKVLSSDVTDDLKQYEAGTQVLEASRLANAIQTASADLIQLKEAAWVVGQQKQADIMDAHYTMVNDPELAANIATKIEQGSAAPQAVLAAAEEFAALFDSMADSYLRERAADVRDVGRRLTRLLVGSGQIQYGFEPVVLSAQEIEPSLAAGMPEDQVRGIVLGRGSTTSHTIIIAKSRSIPVVTGLGDAISRITSGMLAIVDGHTGQVILNPTPEHLAEYQEKAAAEAARKYQDSQVATLVAVTKSNTKVQLAANIGSPADMTAAIKQGAEGVGLFRSEFPFLGRDASPNEEEQFAAYKAVAEQCGQHLCVIRTMDIGGDKPLHYLNINKEENPFLGLRAIRISLTRPELFITQLKAILRAAAYGNVAIMLPMIISAAEIAAARRFVNQAQVELTKEGKAFRAAVPLGIMIETPAAAVIARELATECDFFSIGTNDLVQYTLAVDRGNPAVSSLYSHFHPAVLRLIDGVVKAGHEHKIWVGMCGEMAGDLLAAPLLTAMGLDKLSMNAPAIPRVKEVIRRFDDEQMRQVLVKALTLKDANDIRSLLIDFVQQAE